MKKSLETWLDKWMDKNYVSSMKSVAVVSLLTSMVLLGALSERGRKYKQLGLDLDGGITHQFVDMDGNGKYDFYRYSEKESVYKISFFDWWKKNQPDYNKIGKDSRVYATPLSKEMTKEECLREYRLGRTEFVELH